MNEVKNSLMVFFGAMPQVFVLILLLCVYKWLVDKILTFVDFDVELTKKDNAAFGEAFFGHMIGLGIAYGGAIVGAHLVNASIVDVLVKACVATFLYSIGIAIVVLLTLSKVGVFKEIIEDKNVGVANIVSGISIMNGLVLAAAVSVPSGSINTMVVFWGFGQVLSFVAFWAYRFITFKINIVREVVRNYYRFDDGRIMIVHRDVVNEDDRSRLLRIGSQIITSQEAELAVQEGKAAVIGGNEAAGLSFKNFLIAIGIMAWASLFLASDNLQSEITVASVLFVCAVLVQTLGRFLFADFLLLRDATLTQEIVRDKNIAAAKVEASVALCLALILAVPYVMRSAQAMKVNLVETVVAQVNEAVAADSAKDSKAADSSAADPNQTLDTNDLVVDPVVLPGSQDANIAKAAVVTPIKAEDANAVSPAKVN